MVLTHTLATSGPGGGKRGTVPPAKRGPKYRQRKYSLVLLTYEASPNATARQC